MDAIEHMKVITTLPVLALLLLSGAGLRAQRSSDSIAVFKKRVLESAEVDLLTSLYHQEGDNAAVSGGRGSEALTDGTAAIIISIPLNADDILVIDGGISAYSSASSSNINPWDGRGVGDPFVASTGASHSDVWSNFTGTYQHHSDDRNTIWSGKLSVSNEYDYFSTGFGGSYSRLFNNKNTELGVHGNVYLDQWRIVYPAELRGASGIGGEHGFNINNYTITGNPDYSPNFVPLDRSDRKSYSVGLQFSQILSTWVQGSLALDLIHQTGLLSTPFQRVYFGDVANAYIENFQLADDIERLPDTRLKTAVGGRLNFYISERVVIRSFYRYYFDDWGIRSNTAQIEVPVKVSDNFTVYPSYRFYQQTAADHFAPYEAHISTEQYYTSDFDLSGYQADQFGLGVSYTDIFTKGHIWRFGLKSIDLKLNFYQRDTGLRAGILSAGCKFILD